jgi:hypothetical protein
MVATAPPARPGPRRAGATPRDTSARPDLRLAPDPVRRARVRLLVLLVAVASSVSLFLLVAFNVFVVQGQFELERLGDQREAEQLRYERLREEVARLSAPAAVVSAAERMGMVEPAEVSMIEAPAAAPDGDAVDRTEQTLRSWPEVKSSLGP